MNFTKSTNTKKLIETLIASEGIQRPITEEQTQFSFPGKRRVINIYITGEVIGEGEPDEVLDKVIEAHITSTNAQTKAPVSFQTSVKLPGQFR